MGETSIEWTDRSVNPIRARNRETGAVGHFCEKPSAGCKNCYADAWNRRVRPSGKHLIGTGLPYDVRNRDKVEIFLDESKLQEVLRRRTPTKWFWCDMTDPFGEWVPDEFIDKCFAVMALTPHHTHQVLTKRAERMRAYASAADVASRIEQAADWQREQVGVNAPGGYEASATFRRSADALARYTWPLPNVHLGVSVEAKPYLTRIDDLLVTPAALRFVSLEPLLEGVDIEPYVRNSRQIHLSLDVDGAIANRSFDGLTERGRPLTRREAEDRLRLLRMQGIKRIPVADDCPGFSQQTGCPGHQHPRLGWVIVGGESGPGARPFDLAWARSIVQQCQSAGVPVFCKQLGAVPVMNEAEWRALPLTPILNHRNHRHAPDGSGRVPLKFNDRKGGTPEEWPEDLRVRQFPAQVVTDGAR